MIVIFICVSVVWVWLSLNLSNFSIEFLRSKCLSFIKCPLGVIWELGSSLSRKSILQIFAMSHYFTGPIVIFDLDRNISF